VNKRFQRPSLRWTLCYDVSGKSFRFSAIESSCCRSTAGWESRREHLASDGPLFDGIGSLLLHHASDPT
jgi:hypothetical protein